MADEFDLRDDDRLPWLETVEPEEPPRRPLGTIIAGIVVAVVAVVALVLGIRSYRSHQQGGNGALIAAPAGDYKVKPEEPGGLKVLGEGTSAIATSAGKGAGSGAIDLKAVPEAPVAATAAPAPRPTRSTAAAGERSAVAAVPAKGGRLVAAAPVSAPHAAAAAGGGGSLVQLGAYPSEAAANAAWAGFEKRFAYVAALGKSVQPVAIGGKTLYRLRVNAGSANQAADICGRLKVAGEACFVAS